MFYKKLTLFHIRGSRKKYFSGWVQNNIFVCWKVRWSKAYLCIFTMLKFNKFFSRVAEGDPRFSSRSAHVQNKFSNCKFKYAPFFLKGGGCEASLHLTDATSPVYSIPVYHIFRKLSYNIPYAYSSCQHNLFMVQNLIYKVNFISVSGLKNVCYLEERACIFIIYPLQRRRGYIV